MLNPVKKNIPQWMRYEKGKNEKAPVWFIDCRGTDFSAESVSWQARINSIIGKILGKINIPDWREPVLIKCHIGERGCNTRMLPDYCISTVRHFRSKGMERIVCGDSTVAYTGDRGYRENSSNCSRYLNLAKRHGWSEKGPLGIPFIVLDRPMTSVKDTFDFDQEAIGLRP